MKLYATVTSERASKGQGGNEYIDVDLLGKDGIWLGKFVFMVDANNSDRYVLVEDAAYHNDKLEVRTAKGEKQKGGVYPHATDKHVHYREEDIDDYCPCGHDMRKGEKQKGEHKHVWTKSETWGEYCIECDTPRK